MKKSDVEVISPTTTVEAIERALDSPAIDPIVLSVANEYLSGKTISAIAESFDLSEDRVAAIIEKKEVKSYIDNVFVTQGYLNRVKRLQLINAVIDQKMQDALETGVFSKKDLLDWLKHLHDVEGAVQKKEKPSVAVQVNNNYDSLMKGILDN